LDGVSLDALFPVSIWGALQRLIETLLFCDEVGEDLPHEP
jgi:hypothetical protein